MSRDNPILELWRQADDQWAREWLAARQAYEAWYLDLAETILREANAEKHGEAER